MRVPPAPITKAETAQLMVERFTLVYPRVIDRMCGGETLTDALDGFPLAIERGAFMRWVKKDAQRYALFKEAKEVRSEIFASEMIKHALGTADSVADVELDRSKFIVDTYKFLMKSENRKEFGDTKSIEVSGAISITAALQAAETRVEQQVFLIDDDDSEPTAKMLTGVVEADWEDLDDDD